MGKYEVFIKYLILKCNILYIKKIETIRDKIELTQNTIIMNWGGYPKQNNKTEIGKSIKVNIIPEIWKALIFPEACIKGGIPSPNDLTKALKRVR